MKPIRLRPSEADTWTVCTDQPWLFVENEHRLPKDDTVWSVEGTRAHEVAAKLLETGEADFDNDEQATHLFAYYEWVMEKVGPEDTLLVEQSFPLWYMPERVGNVDAVVIGSRRIEIVDLKYGEGVAVYARGNKQCAIYGRTTCETLIGIGFEINDDTLITIWIYQPRCSRGEPITEWTLTWAQLVEITDEYDRTAQDIKARRNTKLDASDRKACKFCDCQPICPAYNRKMWGTDGGLDMLDGMTPSAHTWDTALAAGIDAGGIEWPDPGAISPEDVARILEHADDIIGHVNKVRGYAANLLASDPAAIPGWKTVSGQPGKRQWRDEKAAETLLSNRLTVQQRRKSSLISPAQAEKLIKKADRNPQFNARWDKLVFRPPASGKVLVPMGDERASIAVQGELEFENLDAPQPGDLDLL